MAYCTVDDIENLLATMGNFTTTTKPTLVQVGEYAELTALDLRGVLSGNGFDPDPTDINAKGMLAHWNATGAAAMVLRAARSKDTKMAESYQIEYETALRRIRQGEVVGLTHLASGSSTLPRYREHDDADFPEPRFHINDSEW